MTLEDGIKATHLGIDTVLVHFERPNAEGFDSARRRIPAYEWTGWEGTLSDGKLRRFEEYFRSSAYLICQYAASGGARAA